MLILRFQLNLHLALDRHHGYASVVLDSPRHGIAHFLHVHYRSWLIIVKRSSLSPEFATLLLYRLKIFLNSDYLSRQAFQLKI